jgi:glycerol kinase
VSAILALDQGTTSSRALVVGGDGSVLGVGQRPLERHYPRPGWVEQDPDEIWQTQHAAAQEALRACGLDARSMVAVGIADQRETTLLWDRATSRAIAPAIVWQDRRTADDCDELRRAGHEDLLRRRTGLLADPYFSATKLRWLLRNVPGARQRAERGELAFGTVDSWLVWRLTGGRSHVTDATNASRTLLYDIAAGDWDDELLDLFEIPRGLLPTVVDSSGVIGPTAADVLGAPLPIAGVAGDQQAALFGQACTAPGMSKVTYGTGCFLLAHAGEQPPRSTGGLLGTVALQRGGRRTYALEGSAFVGGAAVQWLRESLGALQPDDDIAALAGGAPGDGGVVFVPALAGLGAPHWDPHARGAILGLSLATTTADLARATLEGIACQVVDLLAAAAEDGVRPTEVRADGGAARNDLLLQIQADLLGIPVIRAAQLETTAMGAAYLAGLAVGFWDDDEAVARLWQADRRFDPDPDADRERRLADWRAAVAAARAYGGRDA